MKDVIENITKYIKRSELIVFCGAGISFNSGIPLVYEIKKNVLKQLALGDKEINSIVEFPMPFESFMESLIDRCKTDLLFDVFESSHPNTNHYFLAHLAKLGYLKIIITTNFDTLIEQALEKMNVPYLKYYNEYDFDKIPQNNNSLLLIKLHGCISDRNNMAITIKRVAQQKLVFQRMQALNTAFSNKSNKALLIMGYSCSDIFDIIPAIITNEGKKNISVYLIEHVSKDAKANYNPIAQKQNSNPFKEYNGYRLYINTDEFIKTMWSIFKLSNYNLVAPYSGWMNIILRWGEEIKNTEEAYFVEFLSGLLLFNIDDYPNSIQHIIQCYENTKNANLRIESCYALGKAYRELGGNLSQSEYYLNKTIELSHEIDLNEMRGKALNSLGIVNWDKKEYQESIECYDKALSIAKSINDIDLQSKCIGNKAIVLKDIGGDDNWKTALSLHEVSLQLSESIGDKKSEGRTKGNIGRVYSAMGDYKMAIKYYNEALDIANNLSDLRHMAIWHENIGSEYISIDNNLSVEHLSKAKEIFLHINNLIYAERCQQYLDKL